MTWTVEAFAASRQSYRARLDREFWSHYRLEGECWVWAGKHQTRHRRWNIGGYGTLRLNGRTVYAHRVAYERAIGPIPPGLIVMHTCDNPPCINPAHLRVGTKADNSRDMIAKGRGADGQTRLRVTP